MATATHKVGFTSSGDMWPAIPARDVTIFHNLERQVKGVASRGVHEAILKALTAIYGILLLSIWFLFARDRATDLDLAFATFVFLMYFSLVLGGIALADYALAGERQRSLGEYMRGPVDTNAGTMSGQAAAVQILFLPVCVVSFIALFGIMVHVQLPN